MVILGRRGDGADDGRDAIRTSLRRGTPERSRPGADAGDAEPVRCHANREQYRARLWKHALHVFVTRRRQSGTAARRLRRQTMIRSADQGFVNLRYSQAVSQRRPDVVKSGRAIIKSVTSPRASVVLYSTKGPSDACSLQLRYGQHQRPDWTRVQESAGAAFGASQ